MALELTRDGIMVSLTDDAYDYNDRLYTIEVTDLDAEANEALPSGVAIGADRKEMEQYLIGALDCVLTHLKSSGGSIKNSVDQADAVGLEAIVHYRSGRIVEMVKDAIDCATEDSPAPINKPSRSFSPI